jgi:PAS domain S-box-containing protein
MKKPAPSRKKAKAKPKPRAKSAIIYVEKEKRVVDFALRKRAEKKLASRPRRDVLSGIDALKLVHELQVHQIELEMQNEELLHAAAAVDESRARYSDLYDFAPAGYATIDDRGIVLEANLTFARMMGHERGFMLHRQFSSFVAPQDREFFKTYIQRLISADNKTAFEIKLARKDNSIFDAQIETAGLKNSDASAQHFLLAILDVSERKKLEDALRHSEARLESLLKIAQYQAASNQDLLDFALNEAIVLTSSRIGYIYHYDEAKKEFTLDTWSKGVMEECTIAEKQTVYQLEKTGIWGEAVRQGKPIIVNDFHAHNPLKKGYPEGHSVLHNFLTVPVVMQGRIVGVVGVANKKTGYTDNDSRQLTLLMNTAWTIMDRKRMEERLRESEEKYRTLVETADDVIVLTDLTGKQLFRNNSFYTSLGYDVGETVDPDGFAQVHPEDKPLIQGLVKELIEKGTMSSEYRVKNKRGEWISRFAKSTLIRDREGRPQSFLAIIRDITERKLAEEALRKSEKQYRTLFESMDEGFALCEMIYDEAGRPVDFRYIEVNPAFARLTGLPSERVKGRTVKEVIPGIEPFWIETYGRIVKTGHGERIDNPVAELGKHFELYAWRSDPGRFAVVFNDITDRVQAEKLLRVQSEDLVLANKDLEAFGFSVSHDLRNPLHSIAVCCAVIAKDLETTMGKNSREAIGHILKSTQRMSQVITDLLALSSIARQDVHREETNLSEIVKGFHAELKSFNPDRDVEFTVEPDCIANADSGFVRILIENLVRNAWKYTSKTNRAVIKFGLQGNDGQTTYFIRDNGVGFDMSDADRLFKPFNRLHSDKDFKGTGIGLAIVKRIVDKHHGAIWAEAEKDKGATFFFRLE